MKMLAVASGKGGVGKSTVAVNLTLALAQTGSRCGLLDADVYGPSVPMMLGVNERPAVKENKVQPIEKFGIKVISMGLFATEDMPVIWRGPMVSNLLQQFLEQVDWGALDYLIIDLPPGTGDAQLTLTQKAPLAGGIIVTTPQDVALLDARRALKMFQQVNVPVLGIVENMSYFICDQCDKRHDIFKAGGGKKIAQELNVPFLAEIPIDIHVPQGGDCGEPIVRAYPDSLVSQVYVSLAKALREQSASTATTLRPQSINKLDASTLQIVWEDGHESVYNTNYLRENCTCAACQDEWSGAKKIQPGSLPKMISAVTIDSVGNYGLKIKWSDGHATGIYTYETLRQLCQCSDCKASNS